MRWNEHLLLDRLLPHLQTDDRVERQHMRPAQIVIRVRRRKSVEMRPADRGKQQRIRLRADDAVKAWVDGQQSFDSPVQPVADRLFSSINV